MQSCTILWRIVRKYTYHNNKTGFVFLNLVVIITHLPPTRDGLEKAAQQTGAMMRSGSDMLSVVLGISPHCIPICTNLA